MNERIVNANVDDTGVAIYEANGWGNGPGFNAFTDVNDVVFRITGTPDAGFTVRVHSEGLGYLEPEETGRFEADGLATLEEAAVHIEAANTAFHYGYAD